MTDIYMEYAALTMVFVFWVLIMNVDKTFWKATFLGCQLLSGLAYFWTIGVIG